jgi:hypothetical protein
VQKCAFVLGIFQALHGHNGLWHCLAMFETMLERAALD